MREKKPLLRVRQLKLKGRIENSLSGFLRGCLVGLLVLFQFALFIILPVWLHGYTVYFYGIMELFSVAFILVVTNENRSAQYKIGWFCMVLILPISGCIMFSLWGKSGKKNKLQLRIREKIKAGKKNMSQDKEVLEKFCKKHPVTARMSRYMVSEGAPLWKNNQARYYAMGEEAFEDLFEDLENAKKFILIEFFIVADGAIWDRVHEILLRKVREGIEVKFLYDDFGAMMRTHKHFDRELRQEGIEVEVFNPIHRYTDKLFMNYRSHQKIVVIDGNIGYTGGFNLADEYANLVERFGKWKDTGIRVCGDAVWGLTVVFLQLWNVCVEDAQAAKYDQYRPTEKFPENDMYCHVLSDGPALNPRCFIESMYKQMINYSGQRLYIMTPYLVLEDYMILSLLEAVQRGVDVRIITPSIPDKKHIKWLTEYYYGPLLKHGVRIYEYTPGFIHAKVIANEHCGIVGTINMDYRSFYLHYENGVWVYDANFIRDIMDDFAETFAVSREITYEDWKNTSWSRRAEQYIMNVFATLV